VKLFSGERPVDLRSEPWPGTPVLVIHGTNDSAVPAGDAEEISHHSDCQMLRLNGVEHSQAYTAAADEYRTTAMRFLQRDRTA
jgi:pimeloyl-ACP methyl ester carboxylesterase